MDLQVEYIVKMETRKQWRLWHISPVLGSVPQLGVVLRSPQGATSRLRTDWEDGGKRESGDHEGGVGRAPDQCGTK